MILAASNLGVMWLISAHKPIGWLAGIAVQVPWTAYDIATAQYGFLAITAVAVPVYLRGWRRWRAEERRDGR